MTKKLSDKDKRDWDRFIKGNDRLEIKDKEKLNLAFNTETTIDLHGYTLSDANNAIQNLIYKSYNTGLKKIIVITGKGLRSNNLSNPYKSKNLSILKNSVPEFIIGNTDLMEKIKKITYEDVENLNKGSFEIYLKSKK